MSDFQKDVRHPGEDDALLRQVKQVLEPMPEIDRRAIAQIMAKVAERERAPRSTLALWWERAREWWQLDVPPVARASGLVTAALVIGFVARGALPSAATTTAAPMVATSPAVTGEPTSAAPNSASTNGAATNGAATNGARIATVEATDEAIRRVPMQFVLDAREVPQANSVALVGDFNDWDISAAPLTHDGSAWSVTLPLLPGRHVYAFVVNGERWIVDPRAAKAPDADFGRPGSVIIVQESR